MILVTIKIMEMPIGGGKVRGVLYCESESTPDVSKEEARVRNMVFDKIKDLAKEMGEEDGANIRMVEGELKSGIQDAYRRYIGGDPGDLQ